MFSKEESKKLRHEFWVAFGKSYPKNWILYDTKIKGLALKFTFGLKMASVSMDIEHSDLAHRIQLWEKITSLQSILKEEYLPEIIFEDSFVLDNQKEISRIYVQKEGVSIHNKNSWQETMVFLHGHMLQLEAFFLAFKDVISG